MKKYLKGILIIQLVFVFLMSHMLEINALEFTTSDAQLFYVYDFDSDQIVDEVGYYTYPEAYYSYLANVLNYENLGIIQSNKVFLAEYALVYFASSPGCEVNMTYRSDNDYTNRYLNGCQGKDGAFITTNESGTEVLFMLNGTRGWAPMDQVDIIPIDYIDVTKSSYVKKDGQLFHQIKSQMDTNEYAYVYPVSHGLSFLENDQIYLSYDGHYFYQDTDIKVMLDDYRDRHVAHSVNVEQPFYNYYQYLSHRSYTTYSAMDVETYFANTYGYQGQLNEFVDQNGDGLNDTFTRSQLYDTFDTFWQSQYTYGTNAMLLLSEAIAESAYGRNQASYLHNNFFNHGLFQNENEEGMNRYPNINQSIVNHAKDFISAQYAKPYQSQYHGGFLGSHASGVNVSYSSDPYWGEKVASIYYQMDKGLGERDASAYRIGLKTNTNDLLIFAQANENQILYTSGSTPDFAVVIIGEEGAYYKIQNDASLDEVGNLSQDPSYNFQTDIGYVRKRDIDLLLNQSGSLKQDVYHTVTFDADGGTFLDGSGSISYPILDGLEPSISAPLKEGYAFTGWDKDIYAIHEDQTYKAQYKKIKSISMSSIGHQEYLQGDALSLKDVSIHVVYEDETEEDIPVTSSMVDMIEVNALGEQSITVNYCGLSTKFPIFVFEQDEVHSNLDEDIAKAIETYQDTEVFEDNDMDTLLSLKDRMVHMANLQIDNDSYRNFDRIMLDAIGNRIVFDISDHPKHFGVSGLSLAINNDDLKQSYFSKTNYFVKIFDGTDEASETVLNRGAEALGLQKAFTFTMDIQCNYESMDMHTPILVTFDQPDDIEHAKYTVLQLDHNDVSYCPTTQTDRQVSFLAQGSGQFILCYEEGEVAAITQYIEENITPTTGQSEKQFMAKIGLGIGAGIVLLTGILAFILRGKRNDQ